MNRRQFLTTGAAFGVTGLAGCTSNYRFEIADVEGMDDSDVFVDVEVRDETSGLDVYFTPEATLEHGGDTIEGAVRCGGDNDPNPYEDELGAGDERNFIPVSCNEGDNFEVHVVIYDSTGQPVDYITVLIDIVDQ